MSNPACGSSDHKYGSWYTPEGAIATLATYMQTQLTSGASMMVGCLGGRSATPGETTRLAEALRGAFRSTKGDQEQLYSYHGAYGLLAEAAAAANVPLKTTYVHGEGRIWLPPWWRANVVLDSTQRLACSSCGHTPTIHSAADERSRTWDPLGKWRSGFSEDWHPYNIEMMRVIEAHYGLEPHETELIGGWYCDRSTGYCPPQGPLPQNVTSTLAERGLVYEANREVASDRCWCLTGLGYRLAAALRFFAR